MFSFQERAWRRMLMWWSDCWSGGLSVLVPPWEEKGATVCLLPLKRPLRSQKILQEMDPLLKKTDASPCECKTSLYYITMWYLIKCVPVWCFVIYCQVWRWGAAWGKQSAPGKCHHVFLLSSHWFTGSMCTWDACKYVCVLMFEWY